MNNLPKDTGAPAELTCELCAARCTVPSGTVRLVACAECNEQLVVVFTSPSGERFTALVSADHASWTKALDGEPDRDAVDAVRALRPVLAAL